MEMMLHDTILHGDALETLRTLPDECVQTVITSPPYWGLRDYGVPGQLGLERTPDEYVARMVEMFAEVRRVLRADGTCWVNLGDSYANDTKWGGNGSGPTSKNYTSGLGGYVGQKAKRKTGLKPKDLVGVPWMVAFALRADGWYLRSDIIWHKSNPMPESVTDRPTKAHEYIFLLTKGERYHYDHAAILEPVKQASLDRARYAPSSYANTIHNLKGRRAANGTETKAEGRNKRSVWTVATAPFAEAHFATFPPALIEPCVLAGTSPKACEHCGAPWARVMERVSSWRDGVVTREQSYPKGSGNRRIRATSGGMSTSSYRQDGWRPTCRCEHNTGAGHSLILDPFMGAGTVGVVARRHSRHYLGIELNASYIEMAERRIANERQPVLWTA